MLDNVEVRKIYCDSLIAAAKEDERVVVLEADLAGCSGTKNFGKEFPDRMFNVGIAEANMVGIAAGLAACGKIPFCATFTPFITRRALDQIQISVAYSKLNVKLVGTDPGISAQLNGGTHMSFDDMGIMRGIPTMLVFEPTDATMLKVAMPSILKHVGPTYIRMYRKTTQKVYEEKDLKSFDLFKAMKIAEGKDLTIFCSGMMVSVVNEANELLKKENISARIYDTHTWKPIDEKAIIKAAKETGAIVTCENHSIYNGLGSAVSEVVVKNYPVPVEMIGIKDQFGQVGKEPFLFEEYNLTAKDVVKAVKKVLKRKN